MDRYKKLLVIPIVIIIVSLYLIGVNFINRIDRVDDIRDKAFGYETEDVEADNSVDKVNINTATEQELVKVKGIGKTLASRIIKHREIIGEFVAIEELMDVEGIGASVFENIKPYIKAE